MDKKSREPSMGPKNDFKEKKVQIARGQDALIGAV